jgi:hypothetical protein
MDINKSKLTDQEIRDIYDSNMDMTVKALSYRTGRTMKQLMKILFNKEY